MADEKLDVGEAEEEAVEVDVNPDAKQIKSETEPPKETEIIEEKEEEKKDELEDYSAELNPVLINLRNVCAKKNAKNNRRWNLQKTLRKKMSL